MEERIVLNAPIGFIYTNGISYGRIVYLAVNADRNEWELITESEYERISLEEQNKGLLLY